MTTLNKENEAWVSVLAELVATHGGVEATNTPPQSAHQDGMKLVLKELLEQREKMQTQREEMLLLREQKKHAEDCLRQKEEAERELKAVREELRGEILKERERADKQQDAMMAMMREQLDLQRREIDDLKRGGNGGGGGVRGQSPPPEKLQQNQKNVLEVVESAGREEGDERVSNVKEVENVNESSANSSLRGGVSDLPPVNRVPSRTSNEQAPLATTPATLAVPTSSQMAPLQAERQTSRKIKGEYTHIAGK